MIPTLRDMVRRTRSRSCLAVYHWLEYNGIDDDHFGNTIRHSSCRLDHAVATKRMTDRQYITQIQYDDQLCNVTPELIPIRRGTAGAPAVTREIKRNDAKAIQVPYYLVPAATVKTGGMSEQKRTILAVTPLRPRQLCAIDER